MPTVPTILHRWFKEVWNDGREETIDEILGDGCPIHGLTDAEGNELRGPADFKTYWKALRQTFPDINIDVEDTLVDGDRMAARCLVTGTEARSGKPVRFTGIVIAQTRGGKVVETWNNFDFHVMQQQLM